MSALIQLQSLLRDLWQLDLADLDFGLYRLLRLKRQEVETFLAEQLPRRVEESFQSLAGEERAALEKGVSELASRIRREIAEEAILESGEVNPDYRDTKIKAARELLDQYEARCRQLQSVQAGEAQKAEVFNHLYAFFSRYYEDGDFVPRRRYGVRETYAVPYNGEETFFHWANKDQHYVKTGEAFRDYAFMVEALGGPCRVRFVLTEASVPPGNTKGDTRYFFPLPDQAAWDTESWMFRLPFHYRLPTEKEVEKHGKNSKFQEAILENALPKILGTVPDAGLRAALSATVEQKGDQNISLLLKRLRHFARRNTTDYFIHRDLDAFLKRELEFYLKDQVLHIADLEGDLEAKRRTLRVIQQLAEEVIAFLAQIENVQKRLFEKRKFVLRTDYLVPIKEVPRELWKEVLINKVQVEVWKDLFAIEPRKDLFNKAGKVNERFLEEHPTLVVDTAHFGPQFKERLLSTFDDLDGATDGLLIHAENYQALQFLERKCAGNVKCIYIDPPYNTGSDEFIYKDRYRHSSWLAMMEERIRLSRALMEEDGVIFTSIDDREQTHLKSIMNGVFGEGFVGMVTWFKKRKGSFLSKEFLSVTEYALLYRRAQVPVPMFGGKPDAEESQPLVKRTNVRKTLLLKAAWLETKLDEGRYKAGSYGAGSSSITLVNGVEVKNGKFLSEVELEGPFIWTQRMLEDEIAKGGRVTINTKNLQPRVFRIYGEDAIKGFPSFVDGREISGTNEDAYEELWDLFGEERPLDYPKPCNYIKWLISGAVKLRADSKVLDFFAGSGTTGHAIINLNREDGGRRKFILVEMADYFDTVLLPRIQKVMYAPEWKDGKPERLPTREEAERTPRLVKVLRLEGYEDALHNLATEETLKREEPRTRAHKERLGEDAYRLQYLVRLHLEVSASMVNLAALEHPFDYKLEVLTPDGPQVKTVDLVETFNFLYGLHVERLETWVSDKDKRTYRAVKAKNRDGRRVLVLWRDMEGFAPVVERRFLEEKLNAEDAFDEMLINGDTATPGVKSLDGLFKRLLEEGEQ